MFDPSSKHLQRFHLYADPHLAALHLHAKLSSRWAGTTCLNAVKLDAIIQLICRSRPVEGQYERQSIRRKGLSGSTQPPKCGAVPYHYCSMFCCHFPLYYVHSTSAALWCFGGFVERLCRRPQLCTGVESGSVAACRLHMLCMGHALLWCSMCTHLVALLGSVGVASLSERVQVMMRC